MATFKEVGDFMKNIKFNFKLMGLALALGISMTNMSGCGAKDRTTISEMLQNEDEFNLKGDPKTIIETVDVKGNYDVHIVENFSLYEIESVNIWYQYNNCSLEKSDVEYYRNYFRNNATTPNTIFYIDILTGELVSVKYIEQDKNVFKDDVIKTSYLIADIVDEEDAYNYAYQYLGNKDSYTKDDLTYMINEIKKDKSIISSSNKVMVK